MIIAVNDINQKVGKQIKSGRLAIGSTQADFAANLAVSRQQIVKYESGENSVSVIKLLHISHLMGLPLSFFFSEIDGTFSQEHLFLGQYRQLSKPSKKLIFEQMKAELARNRDNS